MNFWYWILAGFVSGIIFDYVVAYFSNEEVKKEFHMLGFRTHHTVLGLLIAIIGVFYFPYFLISLGIGIIASHTFRTKEFVFIEFDKGKKGKGLWSWEKMKKK